MKINIVEKKDQPLLYRTEVKLEVEYDAEVPSRDFFKKQVAKAVGTEENLIIIDKINTKFGQRNAEVFAHVYKEEKKLKSFVREYMQKRHVVEEKKEE